MAPEELINPKASADEEVLQQQYLRALSSFEGIVLGQIEVKNTIGNRLNVSIRAGLIILSMIALSIFVLLMMLSIQTTRISGVVESMNHRITAVSTKMEGIRTNMLAMENQVALMSDIELYTTIMTQEIDGITNDMHAMEQSVRRINNQFGGVRERISAIAVSVGQMNFEVQAMQSEVRRMAEPARTFNRFFPFMP